MKRILFLTETMNPTSGWGRIADEISRRLPDHGFEPVVLTEDSSGYLGKPLLRNSLASLKSTLLNSWGVRPYAKDAVLVHALDAYPYGIIGALATLGTRVPLVMTTVGTYAIMPLENKKIRPFMLWAFRRAKMLFPIVNFTIAEIAKRASGLPPQKRVLLGVDPSRFQLAPITPGAAAPILLSVGALKKRKGYHYVIPALAIVKKTCPLIRYCIVGDTSDTAYIDFLKGEIKKYGVEQNVQILGKIPEGEVLDLYGRCLAFVLIPENHPTNFAGFHLTYLEANAMGKPVIGAKGYGSEEAVQEGRTGFLITPEKPEEIAAVIGRLIVEPVLRAELREYSRAWAEELTWDKTVAQYAAYYRAILGE